MKLAAIWLVLLALPLTPGGSAVQVEEPLAVIVHRSNPIQTITRNQIRDLLLGTVRQWPNRRRVTIVQREAGSPVLDSVLHGLLHSNAKDYNRQLLEFEFRGQEPLPLKILRSDEGACSFVFNVPGAIGFIAASSTRLSACASHVKVVPLQAPGSRNRDTSKP